MQGHVAVALLLVERLLQQCRQALITLAAQALEDVVHALVQAFGKQREALLVTVQGHELGAQVDHVVAQDPLDAVVETVFQPHQRVLLHALIQLKRQ
ncbi:hypothetical protein D3C78_1765980 [compost metagenome]